jgi:ApaG protein
MYEKTTHGVRVSVTPQYLEGHSAPAENRYFWAYTITLENVGNVTVTLRTRHWKITDAMGRLQEVRGEGVVGEQPTLAPGSSFQYTSGCPLLTPSGVMVGSYNMVDEYGRSFDIDIPAFSLDSPHDRRSVN